MDNQRGGSAAARDRVTVGSNEHDLIDAAITLGDKHKKTLGFLPHEGYRFAASKGTLIIVRDGHEVIAYALYRLSGQYVKITHLCVSRKAQGRGLARQLIHAVSERHADQIGIILKCRNDFPANAMWPKLGFKKLGETPGRGKDHKPLSIWWLDHGYPDLFSTGDQTGPLRVMIDLNVFADIESSYEREEYAESGVLVGDWLVDQIELAISTEAHREISNHPATAERERQLAAATKYMILRKGHREIDRIAVWITDLVTRANGPDLSIRTNDVSDVRHLAEAYLAGISVIATRDDDFIDWAALVSEQTSVRVMRPSTVAIYVDELANAQNYRPAQLHSTQYTLDRVRASDTALASFLNSNLGERKSTYLTFGARIACRRPTLELSNSS